MAIHFTYTMCGHHFEIQRRTITMQNKTHTLPDGREILIVELPEGIHKPDIVNNHIGIWLQFVTNTPVLVPLPKGNWKLIGVSSELSEEEWLPFMGQILEPIGKPAGFMVSVMDTEIYNSAKEAGLAIPGYYGLDTDKIYCLIEKLK